MADEPENLTLRLLQEMRAETRAGFEEMRSEMRERFKEVDQRLDRIEHRMDRAEKRQDATDHTLVQIIDALTNVVKVQEQHSMMLGKLLEGQQIIEHDIAGIKMRVGRIEKHTGLVRA